MSRVTYRDESCHIYEWVTSHTRWFSWLTHTCMRYVTYMNWSRHEPICHIHEWVTSRTNMSHTWMSHVTNLQESYHIYESITSNIRWFSWINWSWGPNKRLHTYNPTNLKTCNPTLSYASKPYLPTTIMHNQNVKSDRVCMLQTRSDFTFFLRCTAPGQLATLGGCQNNKVHTATHCNTLQHTTTQQLPLYSSYALHTA